MTREELHTAMTKQGTSLMLCDGLWGGLGKGREAQVGGVACIIMADLCHCIAETQHCKAIPSPPPPPVKN